MKYKTLFRLMLKVVGVLVFAQGVAYLIGGTGMVLDSVNPPGGVSVFGYQSWAWVLGGMCMSCFGLYLFFRGKWIANLAIPGNRPYCQECGYDLTGAAASRCPECDTPFRPDELAPSRGDANSPS